MKINQFLKTVGMSKEDVLIQVSYERNRSIDFIREMRTQLQEDKNLLMNVKKDKEAIGDTTLFNVHTNLIARSFKSKPSIAFRETKEGVEREIKMLNACLQEDMNSSDMKSLKYLKDWYKFWAWFVPVIRNGWDWVYKKNKFEVIDPINVILDPLGDYFSGNYKFVGFDRIISNRQLKDEWYENIDELTPWETMDDWAMRFKRESQMDKDLLPDVNVKDDYEIYTHFDTFNWKKGWVTVANNWTEVIKAWIVEAGDKLQEKYPEVRKFPVAFFFWKPIPDIPCGDRPANYSRDVQITNSKLQNLRLKKAQAELYPMYVYNKDYVKWSDLSFGFNKGIPISTGIDWPQVNLDNLVRPIQKDLRIDTTGQTIVENRQQVESSLGIGNIAQWSTPDRRETAKTNSLVMDSLDILISLNEEIDLIGEEQFIYQWFYGYYENFTDADKKLVIASSGTQTMPLQLKRSDFIIDWNLSIKLESSTETEMKKSKARANYAQLYTFVQAEPNVSSVSKLIALRQLAEISEVPQDKIDLIINKSPEEMKQQTENEILKLNKYVPVDVTDDHLAHLITLWDDLQNEAQIIHKAEHMRAYSVSAQQQQQSPMGNQMVAQSIWQIWAENTQLNSNQ